MLLIISSSFDISSISSACSFKREGYLMVDYNPITYVSQVSTFSSNILMIIDCKIYYR